MVQNVDNTTIFTKFIWVYRMNLTINNRRSLLFCLLVVVCVAKSSHTDDHCICDVSSSGLIANCEFHNLTAVPDCVPNDVKMLLVSGNPLVLNSKTFHRFHNLTNIIMRKVNAQNNAIPVDLFYNNPSIESLSLGWNHLTTLPDNIFDNTHHLRDLDLWANEFTEIPKAVLSARSLETLTLDRNKIETVNIQTLAPLTSLKKLSLRRNPLRCECELKPVYQWAEERNVTHVLSAQCEKPEAWTGRTLLYAYSKIDCELPNELTP